MISLRIDINDDSDPVITATASCPFGYREARVSFTLNPDAMNPTPQPKRREGESDDDYATRCGTIHPHTIDIDPAYLDGLPERLREIMDSVRDVAEHYAGRAAAEHTLSAVGKAPPGVKVLKVGGTLEPKSNAKLEKS